jgi:hypothetical protein
MIFWHVLKLEICNRFIYYLEGFLFFPFRGFFEGYIFLHGEVFEFL